MQAQIVNLLLDLQERLGLSILFSATTGDSIPAASRPRRVCVMAEWSLVAPKRALTETKASLHQSDLLAAVPRRCRAARQRPRSRARGPVPASTSRPAAASTTRART